MKKIGIVGCGIRGRLYQRALATVGGLAVAGMCDPAPSAREAASRQFDGPVLEHHEDVYALGLDAVIVATPDFAHREAAVQAAEAGLALMVEKPLATTVPDAEAIHDAVVASGAPCLVAFENRWNPHFLRVRQLADQGALGDVLSMTGVLSNSYYVPTEMLSWAADSSPAWFLMPHTVDLALWLSGRTPTSVVARGRRGELASRGIDTWDTVHALIGFDDGTVANLQSSWVLPDSMPGIVDFRFEVIGSRGAVAVDLNDQGLSTATDSWSSPWVLPADIDGQEQGMAAWMVRSFGRHLVDGEPLGPGVDQGLLVTRIVDAIHASAASGQPRQLTSEPRRSS